MAEHQDAEKARPRCQVPGCDGTQLGHDLATEFPEATARFDAAMDRLRGSREDRVMPENLHVTPTGQSTPTADEGADR